VSDLRLSLRSLLRTPAFSGIVVVILALGIGANTAIFSVVDAALLKPMPVPDAERVVRLSHGHPQSFVWFNHYGFEVFPEANQVQSFETLAAYFTGELSLFGAGAGRVRATAVTPEFFDVMRVHPAIGRPFSRDDRSRPVVIISHEMWHTRLGGVQDILDRTMVLNGTAFDVIGIMPRGFTLPERSEIWVPAGSSGPISGGRQVTPIVIGRLSPGATASEAFDEIARTPHHGHVGGPHANLTVDRWRNTVVGDVRAVILLIAAASLVVLLVACCNIASLLLTRASARQREFAVRRALGASDGDLVRQILTESLLLSAIAGVAMLPVAAWTLDAIRAWVPVRMYGASEISLDGQALIAAAMLTVITASLFSALPLWSIRGRAALDALRGAALVSADPRWRKFRSGLAVAEVAFALVLLSAAVTVIRAVSDLMSVDLGVRGERVLVVGLDWPNEAAQPERRRQLLDRYQAAFSSLPGIETVAVVSSVPGGGPMFDLAELLIDNAPVPEKAGYVGRHTMASPEYFSAMGLGLLAGRTFTASDHFYAPKVAVISESYARRFGLRPGQGVGRRAILDRREVQIVGVVRDVRHAGPTGSIDATAYVPFAQRLSSGPMQVVIKARTDPIELITAVRAAGARVDPNLPLYNVRTFDEIREMHVRDRRFVMTMLSSFGALTFALAVLGLYAVVSYLVHLRTREIGIRMAMGATTEAVGRSVLVNGLAHGFAGVVIGCGLAQVMSRAMADHLTNIGELDLVTLALVSAAFVATAAIAAWVPARRATRIDPVRALRFE
jgi:predicted permease